MSEATSTSGEANAPNVLAGPLSFSSPPPERFIRILIGLLPRHGWTATDRRLGVLPAVPEEALFVKESSAKPKSALPGGFEVRTVSEGARQQGAVARGGQGRAEPARRGSLDRSHRLFSCRQPPSRRTAVRRSWLLGGQTQRTSPLRSFELGDRELGDRPFLRAGSHGVFRPQPDGLIQIVGHATEVGATAGIELASWLCPSLLRPPPCGPHSGSRRP